MNIVFSTSSQMRPHHLRWHSRRQFTQRDFPLGDKSIFCHVKESKELFSLFYLSEASWVLICSTCIHTQKEISPWMTIPSTKRVSRGVHFLLPLYNLQRHITAKQFLFSSLAGIFTIQSLSWPVFNEHFSCWLWIFNTLWTSNSGKSGHSDKSFLKHQHWYSILK